MLLILSGDTAWLEMVRLEGRPVTSLCSLTHLHTTTLKLNLTGACTVHVQQCFQPFPENARVRGAGLQGEAHVILGADVDPLGQDTRQENVLQVVDWNLG